MVATPESITLEIMTESFLKIKTDNIEDTIESSIIRGDLDFIKFLHSKNLLENNIVRIEKKMVHEDHYGDNHIYSRKKIFTPLLDIASRHGHLDIVKFFHSVGMKCSFDAMDLASLGGHLDVLEFLFSVGKNCTDSALDLASKSGNVQVMKFLYTVMKATGSELAFINASENGHLEAIKYLSTIKILFPEKTIDCAFLGYHFDIVDYLESFGRKCSDLTYIKATEQASSNGNLELFQLLYSKGKLSTGNALDKATSKEFIEIVKFLSSKGAVHTTFSIQKATSLGNIELLEFLLTKRIESMGRSIQIACVKKNFVILRLLLSKKADGLEESIERAIEKATRHGKIEILEALFLEKPRPIGKALEMAVSKNNIQVLNILLSKGIYGKEEMDTAFDAAIDRKSISITEILLSNGATVTNSDIEQCSTYGNIRLLKFFCLRNPSLGGQHAVDQACLHGKIKCLRFLHSIAAPFTTNAMDNAIKRGNLNVIKFLFSIGAKHKEIQYPRHIKDDVKNYVENVVNGDFPDTDPYNSDNDSDDTADETDCESEGSVNSCDSYETYKSFYTDDESD